MTGRFGPLTGFGAPYEGAGDEGGAHLYCEEIPEYPLLPVLAGIVAMLALASRKLRKKREGVN